MALSVVKRPYSLRINTSTSSIAQVINLGGFAEFYDVAHGLLTNDFIYVVSDIKEYNGFWNVTVIDGDNFYIKEYLGGTAVQYTYLVNATWYPCVGGSSGYNAVHNPIVYKLTSDKWPVNSVDTARTVSSYANDLGYTKLTLSGTHGTTELEFVKVTFTGGTTEVYQVLTWYSTTVITINLPYRGGITFVSVQKYYSDYHAKVKIYAGLESGHTHALLKPYEELCEIKAVPDSNGVVTININEILKSKIDVIRNTISDGTMPNGIASFCQFYISYAEAYSYSEGGYTLLDYVGSYTSDSANDDYYAFNARMPFKGTYSNLAEYVAYSASYPCKFLTPISSPTIFATQSRTLGPVSQFFDISFIRSSSSNLRIKREVYRNGSIVNVYYDAVSSVGVGVYRHEIDRSVYLEDRIDLTIEVDFGSGYTTASETKTISVDDSCGPAEDYIDLSWLNYLGGFDYWRFKALSDYGIDIEGTTETSKNYYSEWPNSWGADADTIDFETSRKSRQTIVVRAENLSKEQAEDLAKIKTSPLVQIVNDRTDRRTVILDKSSFVYVKEGERLYSLTFNLRYTDLLPSQSL